MEHYQILHKKYLTWVIEKKLSELDPDRFSHKFKEHSKNFKTDMLLLIKCDENGNYDLRDKGENKKAQYRIIKQIKIK